MKVYFDNVIASALVRGDLAERDEMEALNHLRTLLSVDQLEIVTSRESWREQERTRDPEARAQLLNARASLEVVAHDHRVLGFNTIDLGYRACIASPLVTDVIDDSAFAHLTGIGLKPSDARHVMYALGNDCVRFVTTDPDFLTRRGLIEASYPSIRVVKPSDLLKEIAGVS